MSLKSNLISPIWPSQAHIWEPKAELVSQPVNLSVQSMVNVHPAIHHTTHQIPPDHCGRSTACFLPAIHSMPKFLFKMSRFKQKERSPDPLKYVSSAREEGCLAKNWNINFAKKSLIISESKRILTFDCDTSVRETILPLRYIWSTTARMDGRYKWILFGNQLQTTGQ